MAIVTRLKWSRMSYVLLYRVVCVHCVLCILAQTQFTFKEPKNMASVGLNCSHCVARCAHITVKHKTHAVITILAFARIYGR